MRLKNKVALIAGGTRMGLEVARALAARGARIVVTYRQSRAAADEIVKVAQAAGTGGMSVRADLTRSSESQRLVRHILRREKRLDILISMASSYDRSPLTRLTRGAEGSKVWEKQMAVDLRGSYLLALAATEALKKSGEGRIIFFSDWVAASGRPRYRDYLPYYTAKAGVKALTEALALELAPGILVNAIAPGPILPPPGLSKVTYDEVRRQTPLGRWGGPEEIAKAVLFFIESDFVTGETLRVDGGRHLS